MDVNDQRVNNQVRYFQTDNEGLKNQVSQLQNANQGLRNQLSQLPSSQPVAFSARIDRSLDLSVGSTVVYNVVYTNDGNSYDPTTGLFVCKRKGLYRFDVHVMGQKGRNPLIALNHNNNDIVYAYSAGSYSDSGSNTVLLHLSVGDVVKVVVRLRTAHLNYATNQNYNTFSGQLLA
jgi:hypothetical protein